MVEDPQGHDSSGALSPLAGKKAKTQIRCDRLIAALESKTGSVCLMRNALEEERRGWEVEKGERETEGEKEGSTK